MESLKPGNAVQGIRLEGVSYLQREFLVHCIYPATSVTLRLLASDSDHAEHIARFHQKGALHYSAREAPERYLSRSPWSRG